MDLSLNLQGSSQGLVMVSTVACEVNFGTFSVDKRVIILSLFRSAGLFSFSFTSLLTTFDPHLSTLLGTFQFGVYKQDFSNKTLQPLFNFPGKCVHV